MRVAVVVVAGGSGTRLGRGEPKAFIDLAGRSILERALQGAVASGVCDELVVVAPARQIAAATAIAERIDSAARVVVGGAHRQASVAAGLAALSSVVDV